MELPRRPGRLFLIALCCLAAPIVRAAEPGSVVPTAGAAGVGDAADHVGHKGHAKRKSKPKPKTGSGSAAVAKTRQRKSPRAARAKSGRDSHTINDDVAITPFPSHAAAAKKALAQNRRDQLADAEKAARDPDQIDRWSTVLFHLRELDGRSDAEACFWRVIAFYRLGEIAHARKLRAGCDLLPKDDAAAEAEDVLASGLQPPATLPELAVAGEAKVAPVVNPEAYDGPPPIRLER